MIMPRRSSLPTTGGMGLRGRQKPSLFLVVAGGCRGVLLSCVEDSASFLFGKSIHVTISFVSNRHCIILMV